MWRNDEQTYIVQGYIVTEDDLLSTLEIAEDEAVVEVYARLLAFLTNDGVSGVVSRLAPPIVHVKENGNYIIRGARLAASEPTRHRMAIPAHEDAVVVPKAALRALLEVPPCN
jgi:hypothetical protein